MTGTIAPGFVPVPENRLPVPVVVNLLCLAVPKSQASELLRRHAECAPGAEAGHGVAEIFAKTRHRLPPAKEMAAGLGSVLDQLAERAPAPHRGGDQWDDDEAGSGRFASRDGAVVEAHPVPGPAQRHLELLNDPATEHRVVRAKLEHTGARVELVRHGSGRARENGTRLCTSGLRSDDCEMPAGGPRQRRPDRDLVEDV